MQIRIRKIITGLAVVNNLTTAFAVLILIMSDGMKFASFMTLDS